MSSWTSIVGSDSGRESAPDSTTDHTRIDTESLAAFVWKPGSVSALIAISLAVIQTLLVSTGVTALISVLGLTILARGAINGSRKAIDAGAIVIVVAVILDGVFGSLPVGILVRTLLALLAWDTAHYAVTVSDHLGRDADTTDVELVHALSTATVGVAGLFLGYVAFVVMAGTRSVLGLALLFVGGVILVVAVR